MSSRMRSWATAMLDLERPLRIHLIGAGGAGMSALAKLLWAKGHRVSGSDMRMASIMANLSDLGLDVWEGSRVDVMAECDLVVTSSAVPDSDYERTAAVLAGVTVWDRPQLLGFDHGANPHDRCHRHTRQGRPQRP